MSIELTADVWISLLTLTLLEIVLGIDNIIFVSILANRMPKNKQAAARRQGLLIGMVVRILLLTSISWIMSQEKVTLFSLFGQDINLKKLILILGGLFLLYQSTREIHHKMKGVEEEAKDRTDAKGAYAILVQMFVINIVFSLDSVVTAVGMAKELWVMIAAVVISMGVMMFASGPIAKFVNDNPSIKILALSFLVLIGVSLLAEGFGQHFEKGYVYFSMAFAFIVELINLRVDKLKPRD